MADKTPTPFYNPEKGKDGSCKFLNEKLRTESGDFYETIHIVFYSADNKKS